MIKKYNFFAVNFLLFMTDLLIDNNGMRYNEIISNKI